MHKKLEEVFVYTNLLAYLFN